MSNTKKVAFLMLDNIHHIYHIAPIAFSLSFNTNYKVYIYCSLEKNRILLREIAQHYKGHHCEIYFIHTLWYYRLVDRLRNRLFPSIPKIIKKNLQLLIKHDLIISADLSFKRLITHKNGFNTKFVFCFHGAGDREYPFDQDLTIFDLLLVAGDKDKKKVLKQKIDANKVKVTGYPKFDLTLNQALNKKVFSNNKQTFLYNPHFEESISSWFDWGELILEWFANNTQYNLIFAPHIMLYHKKAIKKLVKKRFFNCENIHIANPHDKRCVDMSFAKEADVYLGDASSQVYEFLYKKRPCFFLNPKSIDWRQSLYYTHWKMGYVINDLAELATVIPQADIIHQSFISTQDAMLQETFSMTPSPYAKRGAQAIDQFMLSLDKTES